MHLIPGDPLFGASLACKQKSRNVTWWNKIKFCFTARHLVEILSKHGLKIRFKNVALFLVFMIIEYVLLLVNVPLCCIKYEGCKPILWHITDDEPTNDIIHHGANSESVFWSDGEIWTHDHSKQNWDNGLYAFTVRIRRPRRHSRWVTPALLPSTRHVYLDMRIIYGLVNYAKYALTM